jgi:LPXTG-motif cell wall-anchored protein
MPAAIGDVHPDPGPEIMAASAAGPLYVLNVSGAGVYGTGPGGDIPLFWSAGLGLEDAGLFGPNRNSNDLVASLVGFGGPSFGDLTGDGTADVTAPAAGLTRLIDLLVPDRQLPSDDHLSAWDGGTRLPLAGSPRAVADLAFFVAPAVADLDGDGDAETIAANSTYTISAFDRDGNAPDGWPKVTGGWAVGTPAVGDWDGDGALDVATTRRDGVVLVWRTNGGGPASWSAWGCDQHHSGACSNTVDEPVGPPSTTATTEPPTTSTEPSEVAAATDTTGTLPATGSSIWPLVLIGLACIAIGLLLSRARRPT